MGIFTIKTKQFITAIAALLLTSSAVQAQNHPTLKELCGRYTFNGEMSSKNEAGGDSRFEPVAENGYTMVIVPGSEENVVNVLGFMGYGGGMKASYNEAEGRLTCNQNCFFVCSTLNYSTGNGVSGYVDAGFDMSTYEPYYLNLVFNVSKADGKIVITAEDALTVSIMGETRDELTYAAGYTLTKNEVNIPASDVAGVYSFKARDIISTQLEDAYEDFDMTVTENSDGKLNVSGMFGLADNIEADYLQDGGIIVLPKDFTFANGLFTGSREGTDENYQMDMVTRFEEAPYLLVEKDGLVTPSSFILNGSFDKDFSTTMQFSFTGGTATKKTSNGIASASAMNGTHSIMTAPSSIIVNACDDETVTVYNAQGTIIGQATGSARFSCPAAGIYLVRTSGITAKVLVK